jgi:hypothetical protein
MKLLRIVGVTTLVLAFMGLASAQTWQPLTHQPPSNVGPMLQLRDGRILVNESQGPDAGVWFIFSPDANGSYLNGTWTTTGHLQSGYAPIYFGSQVMLDGKHIAVEGGEYNNGNAVWTTLGAYGTYTPFGNVSWVANSAPTGWSTIGDAESVLLANGKYMQANCCSSQNALFNGPNSWTATGSVKQSSNDESGFTLLQSGKVLTVDTKTSSPCSNKGSELYDATAGTWSCAATTPVQLYNAGDEELGSAVLMYNNKVFQMGGNVVASAVYDPVANTWAAGPTPNGGLDQADGPGALEPNGKVLEMLSPGLFGSGCQFVEYDPTAGTLTNTANPANCPSDSSFVGHLMILPTGQIMFTDFSGRVEIYTPASGVVAAAKPVVVPNPSNIPIIRLASPSTNNVLSGRQLNGLTGNNAYGDDYQGETNYPLVRINDTTSSKVYYCFTHDDSTHSIAAGTSMSSMFDVPAGIAAGTHYTMQAIANGIASSPIPVVIH